MQHKILRAVCLPYCEVWQACMFMVLIVLMLRVCQIKISGKKQIN